MTLTASEALQKLWAMPVTPILPPAREWVYFLAAPTIDPIAIKIGKAREVRWRLITLQYASPVPLTLMGFASAPAGTERVLRAKFKPQRLHGAWFVACGQLLDLVDSLPIGGPMSIDLPQRWSTETGVPLRTVVRRRSRDRA